MRSILSDYDYLNVACYEAPICKNDYEKMLKIQKIKIRISESMLYIHILYFVTIPNTEPISNYEPYQGRIKSETMIKTHLSTRGDNARRRRDDTKIEKKQY